MYIEKNLILTSQYYLVRGKWETDKCPDGLPLKSFHVSTATYNEMLTKCIVSGYETAQPVAPNVGNFWHPFKVGKDLQSYYYRSDDTVVRYNTTKASECVGNRPGLVPAENFVAGNNIDGWCLALAGTCRWDHFGQ